MCATGLYPRAPHWRRPSEPLQRVRARTVAAGKSLVIRESAPLRTAGLKAFQKIAEQIGVTWKQLTRMIGSENHSVLSPRSQKCSKCPVSLSGEIQHTDNNKEYEENANRIRFSSDFRVSGLA